MPWAGNVLDLVWVGCEAQWGYNLRIGWEMG